MTDPTRLIDRYLDNTLSEQELAQLEIDLASNDKYADAFAHAMMVDRFLANRFEHEAITATMQLSDGSFLDGQDLQLLQDDYDNAEIELVRIDDPNASRRPNAIKELVDFPFAQAARVLSYEFKQQLCARRIPVALTAAAAVLLLALILINPFANNTPAPQDIADNTTTKPVESAPPIPRGSSTVATLTATHNAAWGSQQAEGASAPGSLAPGSKLQPNTRLTLTAGTAEITTGRGAVVILQAPATIELLDNDNAIRLHTGKLVGICETESSKGFLVRTPHMDITDLGTRFGVDVKPYVATEVHVHQGEVIAAHTAVPGQRNSPPQRVTTNQAVRGTGHENKLAAIATDFSKFPRALSTHRFPGTGFGLAEGAVDPNWQLTADANGPLASPMPVTVQHSVDKHYKAVGNDPDRAQWLFFLTHHNDFYYPFHAPAGLDSSRLTFSSQLELPEHVELEGSALFLRFATTEGIHELRINAAAVAGLPIRATKGGKVIFHEIEVPIDQTALIDGTNNIDVVLKNQRTEDHANFYIAWEIRPATSTTQAAPAP